MRTKPALACAGLALMLTACAPSVVVISTDELCRSWRHQTVSKKDRLTDETAAGIEGNNKARPAWGCATGENRAKS